VTGRLVAAYGTPVDTDVPGLTHLFPSAATLARVDPEELPMPRSRGRALTGLARALADGDVALDRGADRAEVRAALVALPGIGPWTADYLAMRVLGNRDILLTSDLVVRQAAAHLGLPADERGLAARGAVWSPWRSYATLHLWRARPGRS